MSFHINKIKISNFLSFFGNQEVELKPYTALICNFDQGKDDFCKAIEFVFGVDLTNFNIEERSELINPVSYEISREKACCVEVTLKFAGNTGNDLQISRTIIARDQAIIEYRLSNELVSRHRYLEKLKTLGINLREKNITFYEKYFNDVIWGWDEDLEKVVTECLRKPFLLDDWKESKSAVKRLEDAAKNLAEKLNFRKIEKEYSLMEKVVERYDDVTSGMDSLREELIESIVNVPSTESSPVIMSTYSDDLSDLMEEMEEETFEKLRKMSELETRQAQIFDDLAKIRSAESISLAKLYYREIRMSRKLENANLINDRIKQIKGLIREEEGNLSDLWNKGEEVEAELKIISENISEVYASIEEIQKAKRNQIRFTPYGRLIDQVRPSKNLNLLRYVLGEELLYGNLIDTADEAANILEYLRENKYEQKEIFLIFEKHNMKLKETLIGSEENGVNIDTLENLLIFLYKLKLFELIPKVPIFTQREFNYSKDKGRRKDWTIFTTNFTSNDIMITADGLMTRMVESEAVFEDSDEVLNRLNNLIIEQEMKHHELNDVHFQRLETRTKIISLEDDIIFLKRYSKKASQRSEITAKKPFIPLIYSEYNNFFKEVDEELQKLETELEESKEYQRFKSLSATPTSQPYDERFEKIQILQKDLEEGKRTMAALEKELRELAASFLCIKRLPVVCPYIQTENLKDKRALYYEAELIRIKKLMEEDDIENYKGIEDWAKSIFRSVKDDERNLKSEIKSKKIDFDRITKDRKSTLLLLERHCNLYFFQTFQSMLDDVLVMVNFIYSNTEDKLKFVTSLSDDTINIVDFKNMNTFLKFMTVLCFFLMISMFEEIPVMVLDNIEQFFPENDESVKKVLGENLSAKLMPNSQNFHFDLMMRIGEYFSLFLKKNITRSPIRKIRATERKHGPSQMLYFAKSDFSLAADHQVLIHQQVLRTEYITEKIPYFSTLKSITF